MTELLVCHTRWVNFETETRLAREWVCSCPKQGTKLHASQLLKLTMLTATFTFTLAASVGKHQSTTHSLAFKNATWFQATHKGSKGRVLWGQEMTSSDTASRQSVFTRFNNQPVKSLGFSSYILTFWEYTSSQASHCSKCRVARFSK